MTAGGERKLEANHWVRNNRFSANRPVAYSTVTILYFCPATSVSPG